jgi:adenine-specific DNA-methyltransferase
MDKLKMHSPDLTQDNIARLRELFSGCVTEARGADGEVTLKVDFDQLRQELSGSLVEGPQERYQLNWPGKREALLTANAPIAKTLRPCREESVDFDTTKNLFIEGDNLDALKLLQETYLGRIKMIYIDPPYNTGKDFVYKDDFSESTEYFLKKSNQIDETGGRLIANTESNGRFHSDWLSMIYSRVKLARNLLSDDGILFVSIDEVELVNLQKCCEEIFGASNVLGNFPVVMNLKGNQDAFGFAETHEYFIACAKNKESCLLNKYQIEEEELLRDWTFDDHGLYKEADNLRATGVNAPRSKRPNLWYPIFIDLISLKFYVTADDHPLNELHEKVFPINPDYEELSWYWSKNNFNENKHNLILKNTSNGWQFYKKQRPGIGDLPTKKPKSFFYKPEYSTSTATTQLKALFGTKLFDGPKPVPFLKDLITIGTEKESIVLDFFCGSASTAQAVIEKNSEDGGSRKFIMVQLTEFCDLTSEAFKAGYKTIAEIAKERIRRAGAKVLEVERNGDWNKDIGFRVLKIEASNMADVYYAPDALDKSKLDLFTDNIRPDRTPEDLLFQVMLDWGVDLALPISRQDIQGNAVLFVDGNVLAACFDATGSIDETFVKELAAHQPLRAVFRDAGFKDSAVKINVEQIFKLLSPRTEVKCI